MASLLVYVEPERLAAVLGDGVRTAGRVVTLRRADLPNQLERLDELSTLFMVTVDGGRAIVVATLENPGAGDVVGEATLHDHDITELLVRLGCDKVWHVPTWAAVPRIVPPNDVDLLRYTLGLALYEEPAGHVVSAAPTPVMRTPEVRATTSPSATTSPGADGRARTADDELAKLLLDGVYESPASDLPRHVYASYLRDIGDPRWELIILQLERCRRGSPVTDREHELVRRHRSACAGSLRPVLMTFEIARGFVSKCVIADRLDVPEEICADPAWATVEDIASTHLGVLTSKQLTSARTARVRGRELATLAEHPGLLPFEKLLPYPHAMRPPFQPADAEPRGLVLDPANLSHWSSVLDGGALARVRALKLDATSLGARMEQLLLSPFGWRLAHLDAWIDPAEIVRWRTVFDRMQLPLLTLRGSTVSGSEILLSIERTGGAPRVIVQSAPDEAALHVIRSLAHGLHEIEVGTPELLARLRPSFATVTVHPRPSLAL